MKPPSTTRRAWRSALALAACAIVIAFGTQAESPQQLVVGPFSTMQAGGEIEGGWKPWRPSDKHALTTYALVKDEGTVVVKATANASVSALTREIRVDTKEYRTVRWRWKVIEAPKSTDARRKEGDDYPASLYVTFDYDTSRLYALDRAKLAAVKLLYGQNPPLRTVKYIWAGKEAKGTILPSPYTDWVKLVVLENNTSPLGQWISEERNLLEDYRRAFGEEPGAITGVAIMTDADNTGQSAAAYYGDILLVR